MLAQAELLAGRGTSWRGYQCLLGNLQQGCAGIEQWRPGDFELEAAHEQVQILERIQPPLQRLCLHQVCTNQNLTHARTLVPWV